MAYVCERKTIIFSYTYHFFPQYGRFINSNRTQNAYENTLPKKQKPDHFRLHNESDVMEQQKSRVVNRISKIFPAFPSTSSTKSESQRPDDNFLMQYNGFETG